MEIFEKCCKLLMHRGDGTSHFYVKVKLGDRVLRVHSS